jgi:hypothetical protein
LFWCPFKTEGAKVNQSTVISICRNPKIHDRIQVALRKEELLGYPSTLRDFFYKEELLGYPSILRDFFLQRTVIRLSKYTA